MATLDVLVSEGRPRWSELRTLVDRARGRPERLGARGVLRLGALYRTATADLVALQRRLPGDPMVADLEALVGRARHLVYDRGDPPAGHGIVAFYSRGYWRLVLDQPWSLATAAVLLAVPIGLGWLWSHADPGHAANFLPGVYDGVTQPRPHGANLGIGAAGRSAIASQIFTHNIEVSLLGLAGGLSGGLVTAYSLIQNGLSLGVVGGLASANGYSSVLVQLIVPHGLLELSCLVVTSAAGLRLAGALVSPGDRARLEALTDEAAPAVRLAVGTAPFLVVAGLTEGFLTPAGLGLGVDIAVGVGWFTLYWALVVWRGRMSGRRAGSPVLRTGAAP